MREAGWKDRILLMFGRRRAVQVSGDSMRPALNDDDVVVVAPTSMISVGDIVLADHPFKSSVTLLKRVAAVDAAGRFDLRGDNPSESSDSRSFGSVTIEDIHGKVVCRLRRGQ